MHHRFSFSVRTNSYVAPLWCLPPSPFPYPQVKTTTKFGKIFTNYAKSKGVIETSLRFFIDQDRLAADDTPAKYDMQDGDEISVMIQQLGGGGCWRSSKAMLKERRLAWRRDIASWRRSSRAMAKERRLAWRRHIASWRSRSWAMSKGEEGLPEGGIQRQGDLLLWWRNGDGRCDSDDEWTLGRRGTSTSHCRKGGYGIM